MTYPTLELRTSFAKEKLRMCIDGIEGSLTDSRCFQKTQIRKMVGIQFSICIMINNVFFKLRK